MSASRAFIRQVAVVVLIAFTVSEAVSLGCFTTAQVKLLPQKGSFTEESCKALCAGTQLQLPLYALYCGTKCACSATIPDVSAQATGCSATASAASCGATIELQYIHSGSADVCELAPYPLTPAKLNLKTGAERMSFGAGSMALTTRGWESAQAETRDVLKYGLHEVKIRPATGVGPVTAFYLIDQLTFPPAQQDEIDLEFLNAGKLVSEPNLFWTNVWAHPRWENVRDSNITSTALAATLGDPSFTTTSGLYTYLIDWQPGYVRYYIEGVLVDQMTLNDGPIPSNPMYAIFSLWTLTNGHCEWFGGCVSGQDASFTAQFADLKRVRCYDPAAPYFNTSLAAWLLDDTTDTTPLAEPPATSPHPSPASPGASPIPSPQSPGASPIPSPEAPGASPIPSREAPGASPIPSPAAPGASPIPSPAAPGASPVPSPASPIASPTAPGDSPATSPAPLEPCPSADTEQGGSGTPSASAAASAGTATAPCARSTPARSPPGAVMVDVADASISPAASSIAPAASRSASASGSRRNLPRLGPVAALAVAVLVALLQAV